MSATDAITALPAFEPDPIMSDIAMPGRDRYAVLAEVRARETTLGRRVPIAAVSAYAHAEDRQRALAAGLINIGQAGCPAAVAFAVRALVGRRRPAATRAARRADPPFVLTHVTCCRSSPSRFPHRRQHILLGLDRHHRLQLRISLQHLRVQVSGTGSPRKCFSSMAFATDFASAWLFM